MNELNEERREIARKLREDGIAEELRTDPNSKYHGTINAAKVPKAKRRHCPKCEQAQKDFNEMNKQWRDVRKQKTYSIFCNKKSDSDIVKHLNKQDNVSAYLKALIRKDMTKE